MRVIVAYATPEEQVELPVELQAGATVEAAIAASGVLELFPEINHEQISVGVYSKKIPLTHPLLEDDRIEIYRPLQVDPKQARRLRAAKTAKEDS
jgi:hypothetical protein